MTLPIVFMYSGQGAQYYGMGRELLGCEPVFRETMETCNDIASDLLGLDLLEEIYRDRPGSFAPFEETRLTHPANFIMGYSLTQMLLARGIEPAKLVGYSLGEYIAAIVAGALPLERAIATIIEQGSLFQEHTPEAGMMAILADVNIFETRPDLFDQTWMACINFANHFVVTATRPKLAELETQLAAEEITTQLLPITRGFHSPLIEDVAVEFPDYARGFRPLRIPMISSRLGDELPMMNAGELWQACREPVRFRKTMAFLESTGPYCYVDVGPAGTLMNFAKYNLKPGSQSTCFSVMNPFGKNSQTLNRFLTHLGQTPVSV